MQTVNAKKSKKEQQNDATKKYKYYHKFSPKWLNIFSPWLSRCEDDANKPFCRACQCRLDCNRCHLERHQRTGKHQRNLEVLISKGEGAARLNLSIRQERSKYYRQRKEAVMKAEMSSQDLNLGMETTVEYVDEDYYDEDGFQYVQSEDIVDSESENFDGLAVKTETFAYEEVEFSEAKTVPESHETVSPNTSALKKNIGVRKESEKTLIQDQKDIHKDLIDSLKELLENKMHNNPPKEKNHIDLFFESVISSVKALSPKLVAEAKMRFSQIICELELRELTDSCPSTSHGGTAGGMVVSSQAGNSFVIKQQYLDGNGDHSHASQS